ncbi:ComEC/Rec2 family competence protein [Parabacteroides faecis]|uniref:ComEC/Rec2 family competence protein n=1 Tax=Parabacteroides TaxID=375288 RepID=UPI000EFFB3E0|nr:ComEC/Rec2 family competence protein [Parabacteroides faecis]MBC8619317.1 ComEC/Rec2 family competence protein [Parabacteroides faecis]RHR92858.1 ComEC/Rec2 family competence protein [Parabacteroides sp. AF14-59]
MIKEIQKRPFVRPLFIWITGILLQSIFNCSIISFLLIVIPTVFIAFAWLAPGIDVAGCNYELRWIWGVVFLSLLLSFSIQRTAYWQGGRGESGTSFLMEFAGGKQEYLLKPFDRLNLSKEEKSVLATITLGYRKGMSRDVRKRFSLTGVAHLLAVSGFHVAVVCGFLSLLFSFLPKSPFYRWLKYLLTLCLLWCFVVITGLAPSAVRAGLMLTLYLSGRVLRRTTDGYNTLAAAAFCMLAFNPLYLFDVGFQLSYLAVLSILFLQPRLQDLIMVRNPIVAMPWGWITVTLAAQAGTTLLYLYYFGQFSLVFLCTNLPLTFLATFLIPAGLIWILLPAGIPGYGLLQLFVEKMTHTLFWIVDSFSRVTQVAFYTRIGLLVTVLGYGSILCFLLYLKTRRPGMLLAGLLLLLFIFFDLLIERFFTV